MHIQVLLMMMMPLPWDTSPRAAQKRARQQGRPADRGTRPYLTRGPYYPSARMILPLSIGDIAGRTHSGYPGR